MGWSVTRFILEEIVTNKMHNSNNVIVLFKLRLLYISMTNV